MHIRCRYMPVLWCYSASVQHSQAVPVMVEISAAVSVTISTCNGTVMCTGDVRGSNAAAGCIGARALCRRLAEAPAGEGRPARSEPQRRASSQQEARAVAGAGDGQAHRRTEHGSCGTWWTYGVETASRWRAFGGGRSRGSGSMRWDHGRPVQPRAGDPAARGMAADSCAGAAGRVGGQAAHCRRPELPAGSGARWCTLGLWLFLQGRPLRHTTFAAALSACHDVHDLPAGQSFYILPHSGWGSSHCC